MEIAALGLTIDSTQAKSASGALAEFATSAAKAETAATKLNASSGKAARASKDVAAALKETALGAKVATADIIRLDQALAGQAATLATMKTHAPNAAAGVAAVGAASKLTANQLLNLSRQGNDVVTMLALGAPAMQVFASQAGQVVDALQSGPGGIAGSLNAVSSGVGGLLRSFLPLAGVLGGVTLATGAYFMSISRGFPDAETTLKKHGDALKAIEERYGKLSDRVKNLGQISTPSILAGSALRDLRKLQDAQAQEMERSLTGGTGIIGRIGMAGASADGQELTPDQAQTLPKFAPIRKEVDALRETLNSSGDGILKFRAKLEEMYQTAGTDEMRKAIENAAEFGETLAATVANAEQLKRALYEASDAYKAIQAATEGYRGAREDLAGFVPDMRTDRDRIESAYRRQTSAASSIATNPNVLQGMLIEADRNRLAGLKEVERQEDVVREGRALDMRSVIARTAAETTHISKARFQTKEIQP